MAGPILKKLTEMGCFQSKKKQQTSLPIKVLWTISDTPNQSETTFSDVHTHYFLGKTLSSVVGLTRLATFRQTGEQRVIKTIAKGPRPSASFYEEIQLLKAMDNPHIVKLLDFLEDEFNFYFVYEHVVGGQLFDQITSQNKLSEALVASYVKQLLTGLSECHAVNIAHRNLRPSKLLVDASGSLKISDFGLPPATEAVTFSSYYYRAPEVLHRNFTTKCDIWSSGVILFLLLSGKPPFQSPQAKHMIRKIKTGDYSLKGAEWEVVSGNAKRLVHKMLQRDLRFRISASEALQDQWIITNTAHPTDQYSLLSMKSLTEFRSEQELQHAVDAYISNVFILRNEDTVLRSVLAALDKDGDGKVETPQLLKACQWVKDEEETENIAKSLEASGFVDFSEFLNKRLCMEIQKCRDRLVNAFMEYREGAFDIKEIRGLFGKDKMYCDLTEDRLEKIEIGELLSLIIGEL